MVDPSTLQTPQASPNTGRLEEYKALRDELLLQMRARDQAVDVFLVVSGTLVGLAIQQHRSDFLLIPVILSLPFLLRHTQKHFHATKIATYISVFIEPECPAMRWEASRGQVTYGIYARFFKAYPLMIFVGVAIISLVAFIAVLISGDPSWSMYISNYGLMTAVCLALIVLTVTLLLGIRFYTWDIRADMLKNWKPETRLETGPSDTPPGLQVGLHAALEPSEVDQQPVATRLPNDNH
ncbi:MAG: hypothetical protein WC641_08390 [Patescibacteria group bacterium]